MIVCYLGLGSNQKHPDRQITKAIKSIRCLAKTSVVQVSSFYWTKAWGFQMQQNFCNAVVKIYTTLPPFKLLKECQKIETQQGRIRKKKWGPRIIDIDILIYGNLKIDTPKLMIPHPHIKFRDFVLYPLKEIGLSLNKELESYDVNNYYNLSKKICLFRRYSNHLITPKESIGETNTSY